MKAIHRIEEYMRYKNLAPAEAERLFEFSNGYLKKQLKRNADVGEGMMLKVLENCPDISAEWLLTGHGNMLKEEAGNMVSDMQTLYHPKTAEKTIEDQYIPLLSFEAVAGVIETLDTSPQFIVDQILVPNAPRCDGAIRITGDSMYPLLKSGDIVAFQKVYDLRHIHFGDMYIVFIKEDADSYITIKWIKKHPTDASKVNLVSYNENYAPREVALSDIKEIALVKFSIRYNTMM